MKLSNLKTVVDVAQRLAALRSHHAEISKLEDDILISVSASTYYKKSIADLIIPRHVVLDILDKKITALMSMLNELEVDVDI